MFIKDTETDDIMKLTIWDYGRVEDLSSAQHVSIHIFDNTYCALIYLIGLL